MKKYILFILCLLFYSCSINLEFDSDKRKSSIETKREKKEIKLPNDIDLKSSGNPLDNHPTWKKTILKKT